MMRACHDCGNWHADGFCSVYRLTWRDLRDLAAMVGVLLILGAVLWVRLDLLTAAVVLLCGGALLLHALVRITEP